MGGGGFDEEGDFGDGRGVRLRGGVGGVREVEQRVMLAMNIQGQ